MTIAYIGMGSNLDGPELQLAGALKALQGIPSTELLQYSSFYQSQPLGPQDQPDYVNAVAELNTSLTALTLLDHLQAIESAQGRLRDAERWGPRTLDLDLLVFGEQQIQDARLTVPHPEIARRNFVLFPLVELTSDLVIPAMGSVNDLLKQVSTTGLRRIKHK